MFDRLFEWHPIGQDKILDNLIKNITDKIENSRKSLKSITRKFCEVDKELTYLNQHMTDPSENIGI